MTDSEFKQWFTGFVEGIEGKTPNAKQWAKIQERVAEITGTPIVERYFYDRYWRPYSFTYNNSVAAGAVPFRSDRSTDGAHNVMSLASSPAGQVMQQAETMSHQFDKNTVGYTPDFDSGQAMYSLGRADAASLT